MALAWVLGVAISAAVSPDSIKEPIHEAATQTVAAAMQTRQSSADLNDAVTLEDVEIIARRGATKFAPVVELDGLEIDAIGAWDIGEVLARLQPLYGGQGEPLILINGQLVALPRAYSGFPPDAAVRIEVLPPEAAAQYGGRAGQTVYNLVLQPRYANLDVGAGLMAPTQGGSTNLRLDAQRGAIVGMNSHQLRLGMVHDTGLTYGDRDIEDALGQTSRDTLSLKPENTSLDLGGMTSRTIKGWGLMGNFALRENESRSTRPFGDQVYDSRNLTRGGNLSLGLTGRALGWQLNTMTMASLNQSRQTGLNDSENRSQSMGLNLGGSRSLISLPAGEVHANLILNHNRSWAESSRDGLMTETQSDSSQFQARLGVPLFKSGEGRWGRLGTLQADLGLSRQEASGTTGAGHSLGLSWQPQTKVRISLSVSESQSGDFESMRTQPISYGPPRTVYDFRRGEAVDILPLIGGNPNLTAPEQKGMNANLSVGPFSAWSLSTNVSFTRSESRNGIGTLSELTEEVQALLPDRFVRGPDGRLIEVDFRPLNMGSSLNESLGGNLSVTVPTADLWPSWGAAISTLQVRMGFNRQLSAYSELLPGQPRRDALSGDGGGRSRQDMRLSMDATIRDIRASVNARWNEGYRSRRLAGVDSDGDLVRDDLMIMDLRVGWRIKPRAPVIADAVANAGANAGESVSQAPPQRRRSAGTELSLDIINLFDTRPDVRLGNGQPAPGYGRDLLDPMGRTVSVNLRRRF